MGWLHKYHTDGLFAEENMQPTNRRDLRGNFLSGRRCNFGDEMGFGFKINVGSKAFQIINANCCTFAKQITTACSFTRTNAHAAADGRQRVYLFYQTNGLTVQSFFDKRNVTLNINTGGAGFFAWSHTIGVMVAHQQIEGCFTGFMNTRIFGFDFEPHKQSMTKMALSAGHGKVSEYKHRAGWQVQGWFRPDFLLQSFR